MQFFEDDLQFFQRSLQLPNHRVVRLDLQSLNHLDKFSHSLHVQKGHLALILLGMHSLLQYQLGP